MNEAAMLPITIVLPDKVPKIVRKEQVPDARQLAIIPLRAFKDVRITAGQFRALGIACSYANRAGLLWAGLERMGQDLGIHKTVLYRHLKKLEKLGYIETVHKGFNGVRADTRRIIYNPQQTMKETMQQTQTKAPFLIEQEQKKARKQAKAKAKASKNSVATPESNETSMPIANDVMRLKNKVSSKIWQLAIARAGTDNDYNKLKQAIDKLLR